MPERIKGITVEIGGDTQGLDKALKGVNDTSRTLQRELNDVQRLLKFDPSNVEAMAQKQALLNKQVDNTTTKLNTLREAEKEVQKQAEKGEISQEQYRAFRREVEFTETSLKNCKEALQKIEGASDTSGAVKEYGKLKKSVDEAKGAVDELKGAAVGLGTGVVAGVGGLVGGLQDYNKELGRILTNASIANRDADTVTKAFEELIAITGQSDSAAEAVSNLLSTDISDNQLAGAIDLINGAYIKFSDTLTTEGIADGIQETFATGEAAGSFLELMERLGVDVDAFNEKLKKADGAEKMDLILQTMSNQGLAQVTDKYKELNPEIQAQAEANANLQAALAALAIAFTPVVIVITELITKLVEWMTANPALVTTITYIVAAIGTLVGIVMALIPIVRTIITVAKVLRTVFLALTGPIGWVVLAIQAAIAIGILLYKNWDTIMAASKKLISYVVQKFNEFRAGVSKGMEGAWKSIKTIWGNVTSFFKGINLKQMGKNIIQGLINGISSMADKVKKAASNIANGIGKQIASILKLGSPSKLLIGYGENAGDGLEIGLMNTLDKIKAASKAMATAVVPEIKLQSDQLATIKGSTGKGMNVVINSPKAVNTREANVIWNRTMKKMQLQW